MEHLTMSTAQILLLGAVAGFTIFLGLPLGRLRNPDPRLKAVLCAAATGILIFLFWDIVTNGIEPVETALTNASDHGGSWFHFSWLAALFAGGAATGLMVLVHYDRWIARRRGRSMLGPGAASVAEFEASWVANMTPARWLAVMIATGIGLHNFAEGLAIGQSAASDEIALAVMLIIGFGLHNATEGFGIVAPMSGDAERPSWRFLGLLGLIGGAPTFFGTLIGQTWTSEALSVGFLALAAGSILYVVIELLNVVRQFGHKTLVTWALLGGIFLGFATDFVLVAAGV
jgi:ZIP family zinc transporter